MFFDTLNKYYFNFKIVFIYSITCVKYLFISLVFKSFLITFVVYSNTYLK
jgi:hypothetical protein